MKQQKMFTRGICLGKSKGYNDLIMLMRTLHNINPHGYFTAYELAKMIDLSPRHINRLLAEMYHDKKVMFYSIQRHGRDARGWFPV